MRSTSPTPAVRAPIIPLNSGISPSFVCDRDIQLEPQELNQGTSSQRGGPTDTGDVSPRELDAPARIQATSTSEDSTSDATKQMELKQRGTKRRRNKAEGGDQVPRVRKERRLIHSVEVQQVNTSLADNNAEGSPGQG